MFFFRRGEIQDEAPFAYLVFLGDCSKLTDDQPVLERT